MPDGLDSMFIQILKSPGFLRPFPPTVSDCGDLRVHEYHLVLRLYLLGGLMSNQ